MNPTDDWKSALGRKGVLKSWSVHLCVTRVALWTARTRKAVLSHEKALSHEKTLLSRGKTLLSREKTLLSREKTLLSREKTLMASSALVKRIRVVQLFCSRVVVHPFECETAGIVFEVGGRPYCLVQWIEV